jgi:hypothetical protein
MVQAILHVYVHVVNDCLALIDAGIITLSAGKDGQLFSVRLLAEKPALKKS